MKIPLASIPPGKQRCFHFDGTTVLVCRTETGVFAVENKCPHAEFPLFGGSIADDVISCPGHGLKFDLRTGQSVAHRRMPPIKVYSVAVDGEWLTLDPPQT